jgi:hypothetical protein
MRAHVKLRTLLIGLVAAAASVPAAGQFVSHTLEPGPVVEDVHTFDLWIHTPTPGDDWNGTEVDIQLTGAGVGIVDPLANPFGPWLPLNSPPGSGDVGTFAIGAGNPPTFWPTLAPDPNSTHVTWLDNGIAPPDAWIGRIGVTLPLGTTPVVIEGNTPDPLAKIFGASITQLAQGAIFPFRFSIIPEPATLLPLTLCGLWVGRRR